MEILYFQYFLFLNVQKKAPEKIKKLLSVAECYSRIMWALDCIQLSNHTIEKKTRRDLCYEGL